MGARSRQNIHPGHAPDSLSIGRKIVSAKSELPIEWSPERKRAGKCPGPTMRSAGPARYLPRIDEGGRAEGPLAALLRDAAVSGRARTRPRSRSFTAAGVFVQPTLGATAPRV